MENKRAALERQGVRIAAVSYDSVELLAHFAERAGIGYPLLSDPDSKIIRDFGILNTSVASDHPFYGIPNPGEYLVAPDGTVRSKFFEEAYQDRFTAGRILVTEFGAEAGGARRTTETAHLKATTWASDEVVRGGNRLALVVELELPPKMHVYAPGVEGYIAVDWSMDEQPGIGAEPVAYPEPRVLELPAIGERVPVYEGAVRFVRDVHIGQPDKIAGLLDGGRLTLRGKLRYQACDDKVCYLPQTLPLEWTLAFEQHDRTRAPEELQRKRPTARR